MENKNRNRRKKQEVDPEKEREELERKKREDEERRIDSLVRNKSMVGSIDDLQSENITLDVVQEIINKMVVY